MKPMSSRFVGRLSAALFVAVLANPPAATLAQDYPSKPIKLMVATNPGGLNDVLGRIFGAALEKAGGQPVVVENNATGLAMIGSREIAESAPDGYSLLIGNPANLVIRPILSANPAYKPEAFTPVALFGSIGSVLLINKSLAMDSVQELIDLAKANPGTITYASQGVAASGHMAMEQFRSVTGVEMAHVPYRGAPQAMTAILGGHVSVLFDTARGDVAEQVAQGNVKALAVTSPKRLDYLPDVPTMTELGYPAVDGLFWVGVFAPAGTPVEVVDYLNKVSNDVFLSEEIQSRFKPQGMEFIRRTPQEVAEFMDTEHKRWGEVIKVTGLTNLLP